MTLLLNNTLITSTLENDTENKNNGEPQQNCCVGTLSSRSFVVVNSFYDINIEDTINLKHKINDKKETRNSPNTKIKVFNIVQKVFNIVQKKRHIIG